MTDDVSRETPAVPPEARRVFAVDRVPLVEQYARILADDGVMRGLIGPREVPRLWSRHLLNCGAVASLLPRGATVADIGSGAGLPGLVLALARPDLAVTLVEPLLRRTTFLEEVVTELGLDHVEVVRGRADALHGRRRFDVVTSRAVAPLERLLPWSMPLVAGHGELIALKGAGVQEELQPVRALWERWHLAEPVIEEVGADLPDGGTWVLRVAWQGTPLVSLRGADPVSSRTRRATGTGPRSTRRR